MSKLSLVQKYIPLEMHGLIEDRGDLFMFPVAHDALVDICTSLHSEHRLSLLSITAFDERASSTSSLPSAGAFKIVYLFGAPAERGELVEPKEHIFIAPYITTQDSFPSITPAIHEAMLYERKIWSFFGLKAEGHPELRSIILHENWPSDIFPLRKDFKWNERPARGNTPFHFRHIKGEGIYELPVGPVHAGIIEPGHFRFNLAGEEILLLEPRLGYSHKGTEKLFETLPIEKTVTLAERISGDSSFHYALLWCQTLEKLTRTEVPARARALRTVFAELERIANHLGDMGAIMTDTGFNFGGAQGSRLREGVMRINEWLTGSRFLRGVCTLGGVSHDMQDDTKHQLHEQLDALRIDLSEVLAVADDSLSLFNRLKGTGVLDAKVAHDHGTVGVPLRALGVAADARVQYSYAAYPEHTPTIAVAEGGDVYARYKVRIDELFTSISLIQDILLSFPEGPITTPREQVRLVPYAYAACVVEGWRGPIVCLASTDEKGALARVDLRDPSFLNWEALGYAGKGNMVPDFPLINKSFSLSYSGNDL